MIARNPESMQRSAYRQKLDLPIDVKRIGSTDPPGAGTLMDISLKGCRLRSKENYEIGTRITFDFPVQKGTLRLTGKVISRENVVSNFILDYGVVLLGLAEQMEDLLTAELMRLQQRDAHAAAEAKRQVQKAISGPQTRLTYREHVRFPVRFVHATHMNRVGYASDISMDGMRLWTDIPLQTGGRIHMAFTLPAEQLKKAQDRTQNRSHANYQSNLSREPFKEIQCKGLVVARLVSDSVEMPHGVKFMDLHPFDREELARFIHLLQLSRLAEKNGTVA